MPPSRASDFNAQTISHKLTKQCQAPLCCHCIGLNDTCGERVISLLVLSRPNVQTTKCSEAALSTTAFTNENGRSRCTSPINALCRRTVLGQISRATPRTVQRCVQQSMLEPSMFVDEGGYLCVPAFSPQVISTFMPKQSLASVTTKVVFRTFVELKVATVYCKAC